MIFQNALFPSISKGKRKNKYAAVNFANMILLKFFDFYDSQRKKETQTVKPSKTGIQNIFTREKGNSKKLLLSELK